MELKDLTITDYFNEVTKKTSTPGGGSVLALVNESAASLILMACNFTLDKKGYENVNGQILNFTKKTMLLKENSHSLIDEDAKAFSQLMNAFKSKNTELISNASFKAAKVPLDLLKISDQLILIAKDIIKIGNKNLSSDVQIAYDLLKASLKGTLHHININMSSIIDNKQVNEIKIYLKEREKYDL